MYKIVVCIELYVLVHTLCHHMVFSSRKLVVWIKMLGYVGDTSGSTFVLLLTHKNNFDLDNVCAIASVSVHWCHLLGVWFITRIKSNVFKSLTR
jgi:hypothetical protein